MKLEKKIDDEISKKYKISSFFSLKDNDSEPDQIIKDEIVETVYYADGDIKREVLDKKYLSIENEELSFLKNKTEEAFKVLFFNQNSNAGLKSLTNIDMIQASWSEIKSDLIVSEEAENSKIIDTIFKLDEAIMNDEFIEKMIQKIESLPIEFPNLYGIEIKDNAETSIKMEICNLYLADSLKLELKFKPQNEKGTILSFQGKEDLNFDIVGYKGWIMKKYNLPKDKKFTTKIAATGEYILDETTNLISQVKFLLTMVAEECFEVSYGFEINETELNSLTENKNLEEQEKKEGGEANGIL